MPMQEEVHLLVEYGSDGRPHREPLDAERLGGGIYLLLRSPGFVLGIAAGDEFRLTGADGAFEVVRRGGNVVVQVFAEASLAPHQASLSLVVESLGGRLDAAIDQALVFTVPATVGFDALETVFNSFARTAPGVTWMYGNVFDPRDGCTPLDWWK
ncbi:MAG: DUF4265 domain-containing protein [Hylemonella sp.]|nr:DUF4265 domain-containing protein [Hylemonella sp.]